MGGAGKPAIGGIQFLKSETDDFLAMLQFVVPMEHFMMKELVLRVGMSYTEEDFREVVEEFVAGKYSTSSESDLDRNQ